MQIEHINIFQEKLTDPMSFKKGNRRDMSTCLSKGIARTLTLGLVLAVTVICVVCIVPDRYEYIILSPLHDSRVRAGQEDAEEFVYEPVFNLSAINAACNLDIPEELFTTCRNKVYPVLDKVKNQTQMAISPRIHMLGERHSATNLAAHLAVRNFELVFNKTGLPPKLPKIDFGINKHKHQIQKNGTYERGLSIISIKNPYDYTRSMLKECYKCGPQEKNRGNPAAFVGTEWHKGDHVGEYHFENLMAMRKEKYCNYIEMAAELTDCIMMVHSEDNIIPMHQERYVWRMAALTGWPIKNGVINTKGDYSGHAGGGRGFQLSELVKGITYFKKDFSEHEEDVIRAVNDNMIDDFENAFGYHRIALPEKPPEKIEPPPKPKPSIHNNEEPKKKEEIPENVKPVDEEESQKKHSEASSDIPLAKIQNTLLDAISSTQFEELLEALKDRKNEDQGNVVIKSTDDETIEKVEEKEQGKQTQGEETQAKQTQVKQTQAKNFVIRPIDEETIKKMEEEEQVKQTQGEQTEATNPAIKPIDEETSKRLQDLLARRENRLKKVEAEKQ